MDDEMDYLELDSDEYEHDDCDCDDCYELRQEQVENDTNGIQYRPDRGLNEPYYIERKGADPEFFIMKDGEVIAPHELGFPPKDSPRTIQAMSQETFYGKALGWMESTDGSVPQVHRDGMAVEINPTPSSCNALFTQNVAWCCSEVERIVDKRMPGAKLVAVSTVTIDPDKYRDAPKDVMRFGCDVSFDAYGGTNGVGLSWKHPERYAGGHMHFSDAGEVTGGLKFFRPDNHRMAVKLLDKYVGLAETVVDGSPALFARRKHYGRAGEFRSQTYKSGVGLEYRVPGSEMFSHPAKIHLFFKVARWVMWNFERLSETWDPAMEPIIRHAIDTGEGAVELLTTVPGCYTPESIKTLASMEKAREFVNAHQPAMGDYHNGWPEFAHAWGIAIPEPDEKDAYLLGANGRPTMPIPPSFL